MVLSRRREAEEKGDKTNAVKKQQEQETSQTEFQKLYDEARRIALVLGVEETWPKERCAVNLHSNSCTRICRITIEKNNFYLSFQQ